MLSAATAGARMQIKKIQSGAGQKALGFTYKLGDRRLQERHGALGGKQAAGPICVEAERRPCVWDRVLPFAYHLLAQEKAASHFVGQ